MDELLPGSASPRSDPGQLQKELTEASAFLRQRLRGASTTTTVRWSEDDTPPAAVTARGEAPREEIERRCAIIDQLLEVIRWADAHNYRQRCRFNAIAHRPRRSGGGGNHLVLRRERSELRVEVSTYTGATLVRSEVERLLRRLDVPRSTEERTWPAAKLAVLVPSAIADTLLSKTRPRRCAYWALAQFGDQYLIEVIPVFDRANADGESPVVPVPYLTDSRLAIELREAGATLVETDGEPRIQWPVTAPGSWPTNNTDLSEFRIKTSVPDDWRSKEQWDAYWRGRAIAPDVANDLHPVLESVFFRYLFRQNKAGVRDRTARILCVANGLSLMPHALEFAGFDVTVLELSDVAVSVGQRQIPSERQLRPFFQLAVEDLELSSFQEFSRPSGSLHWIQGDLMDADKASGPFEIIVATRFLEGLSDFHLRVAAARIVSRLDENGWCWVVVQNSGFKWITAQRELRALGLAVVPYDDLPASGKAMSGGLTSG